MHGQLTQIQSLNGSAICCRRHCSLRKKDLRLLLVHPTAKESKGAENHLWIQKSYALISICKQHIAALDRALQTAPINLSKGDTVLSSIAN